LSGVGSQKNKKRRISDEQTVGEGHHSRLRNESQETTT